MAFLVDQLDRLLDLGLADLAGVDEETLADRAAGEALAGSGRRHDPDAVTSVARCLPVGAPRPARTDFVPALRRALEDAPPV